MKKVGLFVIAFLSALLIAPAAASAMTVTGPFGTQVSGWFKDSVSFNGTYNPTCLLPIQTRTFTYTAGAAQSGTHSYYFVADTVDNPYVMLDTSSGTPQLITSTCPPVPTYHFIQAYSSINLDAKAPTIGFSSQPPATATASTIPVSGFVSDGESGVTDVVGTVNGAAIQVSLNGNTFSAAVNLVIGTNSLQFTVHDKVGHSSNVTATVTRQTDTSGSGTITPSPSPTPTPTPTPTPSPSSTPSESTSNSSATPTVNADSPVSNSLNSVSATSVKYSKPYTLNIKDIASQQKSSNPSNVLGLSGLAGAKGSSYYFLVGLAIILFLLCIIVFLTRYKDLFAKLDKNNSGLRKKIILIVTIPSMIPLLGLGYLGYHQLTLSVKDSLSNQLYKAAQTSSLKLERDFALRRTVITKTTSDILQIQNQFDDQRKQLTDKKQKCKDLVSASIPKSQYSTVTSSDDCLPFLAGFAQLVSSSGSNVTAFQKALDDGYTVADQAMLADEQQRVNELLGAVRKYFPEILELSITDNASKSKQIATLPSVDNKQFPVTKVHADLLKSSQKESVIIYDNTQKAPFVLLTYPVSEGNDIKGLAVTAFGFAPGSYISDVYNSTPKPYSDNKVFFVNTDGALIYPTGSKESTTVGQNRDLANASATNLHSLNHLNQHLVARSSSVLGTNWSVAVAAPAKTILTPLAGVQRTALIAIACFIMLSLLLAVVFVYGIANEIQKLLSGAVAYAKGNLDYRIKLHSKDELQVLGDTMDQMAAEIKTAQEALIEKDKEFINIATHELKAPMTSIIGNLDMVMADGVGQVDDTARGLLSQAYIGTQRLRNLVTDMLDVARLESGHAEFAIVPLDFASIINPIIEMQQTAAKEAQVTIQYNSSPDLPKVLADKGKLEIIVTNFISNAIKYNKTGGSVTISHSAEETGIKTSITDTGLGIPDDQKQHMFEKFYRVKDEDRVNVPGTGLGMHLTKRFIEGMGGSVGFESTHGQGTTFHFTLPTEAIQKPPTELST